MIDLSGSGRGTFFPKWSHFLTLAAEARDEAQQRTTSEPGRRLADASLSAILFSVLAAEAFINELAEAADRNAIGQPKDNLTAADHILADLATILQQLEDDRAQLGLKYQMASKVLIGATFETNQAPFQDFMDLIRLRDDLVHPRHRDRTSAAGHVEPRSKIIKNLQQRGLTTSKGRKLDDPPGGISWVEEIESTGVANWAYAASRQMIAALLEMLPGGESLATDSLFRAQLPHLPV